ncbi:MAG: hypothetical protein Q4C52_12145 [Eubacteriales bacterium]|nr:hypothetical protein [Eubacteriales bacterium]
MKKRQKSVILLVVIFAILLSNVAYASGEEGTDGKREYLISKGYDEEILGELSDSDINVIYERTTGQMPEDVSISSKSMDWIQAFDDINPNSRDAISASQLQLKGMVTNFGDSSGNIIGCEIVIFYDWLVTPGVCGEDLISLNWDDNYFTLSDFYAHSTVKNISNGKTEYSNFISTPHTAQNGGLGWYAELQNPNFSPKIQSNPGGYAVIFFEPAYSFKANDNIVKNFNITYVHDKFPGVTSIGVLRVIVALLLMYLFLRQILLIGWRRQKY